jgi:hypothetical protein
VSLGRTGDEPRWLTMKVSLILLGGRVTPEVEVVPILEEALGGLVGAQVRARPVRNRHKRVLVWGLGFQVWRVYGLGFRVESFGCSVEC